jgi:hypothetical protein
MKETSASFAAPSTGSLQPDSQHPVLDPRKLVPRSARLDTNVKSDHFGPVAHDHTLRKSQRISLHKSAGCKECRFTFGAPRARGVAALSS